MTRATIRPFGLVAKKTLLAADSTPPETKDNLEKFQASDKWAKKFVARHKLVSKVIHGEAGSVDVAAVGADIEEIREVCKNYKLENIFNVDATGIFYKLLPKRTYLAKAENCKTARGTKDIKAKDRVSTYNIQGGGRGGPATKLRGPAHRAGG